MCGVAVVLGGRSVDRATQMVAAMRHRGIRDRVVGDDSPYAGGWAVGHVRLPIVGVGKENDQPVERGRWTVAFVGEVLDFRDHDPLADCDLGLVADTWADLGPEGFRRFDGFWSVIAYDRREGEVHLLVDYLSQKPLYVRDDEHALAAASEPDAVACLGPVVLDQIYLAAVVKWGYCPEVWRTPYLGVRRMLPGEHAVMRNAGPVVSQVRYDRADVLEPTYFSPGDLKAEVEAAVRRRVLSADVPVACLVSGGLDSAITYTLARRYGDVRAYHVENGEQEDCLRVAPDATVLDCREVTLRQGVDYMQEPIDLGSLLPQVALADAIAASGGERVCLTGDGADELFGGYGRSLRYDSQASDVWHELVGWHLPRLDRVMMRRQVEVRSPFLARRAASAALGLPRALRTDKGVLRNLFRGDLLAGVADLPKRALRTGTVEQDREANSVAMVEEFLGRVGRCRG